MSTKLFKQALPRLVAAAALALPLAAVAAPTATAVWRSNFGQIYTTNGVEYALASAAGTLNADGTVTAPIGWVSGQYAPYINLANAGVDTVSVLVKYSGFSTNDVYTSDSAAYGIAFAAIRDSDGNEVGTIVQTNSTTLQTFHFASNVNAPTPKTAGSQTVVEGTGYLLFSYKASTGCRTYMGTSIDALGGGEDTASHWSNKTVTKLSIGGDATLRSWDNSGFNIEEVAIFVGAYLSNDDVADYVFPTVTKDNTSSMTMTELNSKVAALASGEILSFAAANPVVTCDVGNESPSDATKAYLRGGVWRGTVSIKDKEINNLDPTIYGNPKSTLRLSGVSGYWKNAGFANTATPAIELFDSETTGKEYGYHASNGYSFYSGGGYNFVHTPELKGSGTYKTSGGGDRTLLVVDKWENFTGTLNLDGKAVWFGTGAPTQDSATWGLVKSDTVRFQCDLTDIPDITGWTASEYSGTVEVSATPSSVPSLFSSNVWSGVVKVVYDPGNVRFVLNDFGNASSVVEIIGSNNAFSAFPATDWSAGTAPSINPEIVLTANWTIANGWDNTTTYIPMLSGTGNLIVDGGTGGSTPIPYKIVSLIGYAGTLGGARGQFSIENIYLDAAPSPGDKLVSLNVTKEFQKINLTTVYVNDVEDSTIELEVKADGIYVVDPDVAYVVFQEEVGQAFVDVTNCYLTVSNAIAAARSLNKVVYLKATPDARDTYNISVGETVRIKKNGFTYDGIVFPQGAEYDNTTTETGGITLYKSALYTALVAYPGQAVESSSLDLPLLLNSIYQTYTPDKAGTVVTVLDGSDGIDHPAYVYNSEAHTYTLKTMVASVGEGVLKNYYTTLSNALDEVAAQSGAVTLLDNVTLTEALSVAEGKTAIIDLAGKTITGPAGGYVIENAGSVVITGEGTVTGAGGIATNTTSGASLAVSNGTFTVTGDLFGNVEGGTIAVSGGTFSGAVADEYLAEGFELKDNGDGTYGIRVDKGWVYEDYQFTGYTGSWQTPVSYGSDNKIRFEETNTYTAASASAGQMVTLTMTASFDTTNDDEDAIAGAKAAVRLGAGETDGTYVFQLYMTTNDVNGCWVDVAASGVTATTNTDYTFTFILDMTKTTYTAMVGNDFLGLAGDGTTTNFYFATSEATDSVQSINFRGCGTLTSIEGDFESAPVPAQEFVNEQTIGSVTLNAAQAGWLNGQNNYAALSTKLLTMTQTQLDEAYLLNLDITNENYDEANAYSFTVTGITFDTDGEDNETIVVTVSLDRNGAALPGGINGTLKLKGGDSLPTSSFTELSSVDFTDDDFSEGTTTTCTFLKGAAPAKFYLPVIE